MGLDYSNCGFWTGMKMDKGDSDWVYTTTQDILKLERGRFGSNKHSVRIQGHPLKLNAER